MEMQKRKFCGTFRPKKGEPVISTGSPSFYAPVCVSTDRLLIGGWFNRTSIPLISSIKAGGEGRNRSYFPNFQGEHLMLLQGIKRNPAESRRIRRNTF